MSLTKREQRLLRKIQPRFSRSFIDAIREVTSAVQLRTVIEHLEAGNIEDAVASLRVSPNTFAELDYQYTDAYRSGGVEAIKSLPPVSDPFTGGRVVLSFDARHVRAEAIARRSAGELVQSVSTNTLRGVRTYVVEGLEQGQSPSQVARRIVGRVNPATGLREGGILGLNRPQSRAVTAATAELDSGDYRAFLTRSSRDKRFDRTLKKAIKDGTTVPQSRLDEILRHYTNRKLLERGDTIAQSETLNAMRAGKHEGFHQLVDSGQVQDDDIEREWDSSGDSRVRDDHKEMDGRRVRGIGTPFTLPDLSQMMHPGDGSLGADASQRIRCRCVEVIRVRRASDA